MPAIQFIGHGATVLFYIGLLFVRLLLEMRNCLFRRIKAFCNDACARQAVVGGVLSELAGVLLGPIARLGDARSGYRVGAQKFRRA